MERVPWYVLGAFLLASGAVACGPCGYNTFVETRGTFSAAAVVPGVPSSHGGQVENLSFALDERASVSLTISLRMTTDVLGSEVSAVHIHRGVTGENGPVVFTLPERFLGGPDSLWVQASFDYDGDLPMEELIRLARSGSLYVDVHTRAHPEGELRAQLGAWRFDDRSGYYCS